MCLQSAGRRNILFFFPCLRDCAWSIALRTRVGRYGTLHTIPYIPYHTIPYRYRFVFFFLFIFLLRVPVREHIQQYVHTCTDAELIEKPGYYLLVYWGIFIYIHIHTHIHMIYPQNVPDREDGLFWSL